MDKPPRDICPRTFQFALSVISFCRKLDAKDSITQTLSRQLLRAATSIGANVEEAQGGQSRADFLSKYAIARKEARETHYWLRLLGSAQPGLESEIQPLIQECSELIAILTAIIKNTRSGAPRAQ